VAAGTRSASGFHPSLASGVAAPRVERIVDEHPEARIAWSSGDHARQSSDNGEQPRRLRGEVRALRCRRRARSSRASRARDREAVGQTNASKLHSAPRASIDVRDVRTASRRASGERAYLVIGHIEEPRRRVDEPSHEPGQAMRRFFGPLAGSPNRDGGPPWHDGAASAAPFDRCRRRATRVEPGQRELRRGVPGSLQWP